VGVKIHTQAAQLQGTTTWSIAYEVLAYKQDTTSPPGDKYKNGIICITGRLRQMNFYFKKASVLDWLNEETESLRDI